jgi:hypothetical protein
MIVMGILPKPGGALRKLSLLLVLSLVVAVAAVVGLVALLVTGGPDWAGVDSEQVERASAVGLAVLLPLILLGLLLLWVIHKIGRWLVKLYLAAGVVVLAVAAVLVCLAIW